jgi:hypothetical protein
MGLSFTTSAGPRQRSHGHILLPQIRDSSTWRARSPYLYPPGRGWPGYTPRHWDPPLTELVAPIAFKITPRHGPRRYHHSSIFARTLVTAGRCPPSRRPETSVASRSLPNNRSTRYSMLGVTVVSKYEVLVELGQCREILGTKWSTGWSIYGVDSKSLCPGWDIYGCDFKCCKLW